MTTSKNAEKARPGQKMSYLQEDPWALWRKMSRLFHNGWSGPLDTHLNHPLTQEDSWRKLKGPGHPPASKTCKKML